MALKTPEFLQTKQYSALRDRLVLAHGGQIQAGVWDATDYKVVQRALGATMSVDVGAGFALVPANQSGNNGLYHVENDAMVNVPISAAHATLPRVDQVVLTVNDSVHGGASTDTPVLTTLDGTPTSGATIDNRNGAVATLPAGTLRIADVFVGNAVTSITTANIRDRRPWARGAYRRIARSANAAGTNDYTIATGAALVLLDATNLQPRIECSGAPLRASFRGRISLSAISTVLGSMAVDGVPVDSSTAQGIYSGGTPTAGAEPPGHWSWDFTPAAGSHLIGPMMRSTAAGALVFCRSDMACQFVVEEIVRPNADNT